MRGGRRTQTRFACVTRGLRRARKVGVDYAGAWRCLPRRRGLTRKRMAFSLGCRAALATGSPTASVVAWRFAFRKWHRPPQRALVPLSQLAMQFPRHGLRLSACAFPSNAQALHLFLLSRATAPAILGAVARRGAEARCPQLRTPALSTGPHFSGWSRITLRGNADLAAAAPLPGGLMVWVALGAETPNVRGHLQALGVALDALAQLGLLQPLGRAPCHPARALCATSTNFAHSTSVAEYRFGRGAPRLLELGENAGRKVPLPPPGARLRELGCVFSEEPENSDLLGHGNLALRDQLADGSGEDRQVSGVVSHEPQNLQRAFSRQLQERRAAAVANEPLPRRLAGHAAEKLAEGRVWSKRLAALATAGGRVRIPDLLELFQISRRQLALLAGRGWLIGTRALRIEVKARPFPRRAAAQFSAKKLHELGAEGGQIGIGPQLLMEPL